MDAKRPESAAWTPRGHRTDSTRSGLLIAFTRGRHRHVDFLLPGESSLAIHDATRQHFEAAGGHPHGVDYRHDAIGDNQNCMSTDRALQRVFAILESAGTPNSPVLPTLLYEEGWLLRLVLALAADGIDCLPFKFAVGARWLSEARLYSAFLAGSRQDGLAEKHTHADAVAGHVEIGEGTKSGLALNVCGSQFVVIEAKISSPLSSGTTRAPYFDQAARNVACMAENIRRCGKPIEQWGSLAFFVFAPKIKIEAGTFAGQMTKQSIASKIDRRIKEYPPEDQFGRVEFQQRWVAPLLDRLTLECVSWESIIGRIRDLDAAIGNDVQKFYEKTLMYNGLSNGEVIEGNRRFGTVQVGR
jgi:hypothetical protein